MTGSTPIATVRPDTPPTNKPQPAHVHVRLRALDIAELTHKEWQAADKRARALAATRAKAIEHAYQTGVPQTVIGRRLNIDQSSVSKVIAGRDRRRRQVAARKARQAQRNTHAK